MSEDQVDLNDIVQVYHMVLKKMLFQLYLKDDKGLIIRKILKFFLPFVFISTAFTYFVLRLMEWDSIAASDKIISLSLIMNEVAIIVRLITFCLLPKKVESLFLKCETFHCNNHRKELAIDTLNIIYKKILKVDFWASLFFATNFSSWFILPVIISLSKTTFYIVTGQNITYQEWVKELPTTFVSDIHIPSPWVELRYALEAINASVGNLLWLTSDMAYFAIVNLLKTQMTLLGESIIRNHKLGINDNPEPMCIKYFIEDHNKLIKVCNTLVEILSPVLGAQLLTTGVLLGGILLNVTSGPESDNVTTAGDYALFYLKFLIYMALALMELYLFCWLSDITNNAFVSVGEAIYSSEWYSSLDSDSKSIIPGLKIAQKGIQFNACKMVKIDLGTFIEVLRVSYSWFTIMKQGIID